MSRPDPIQYAERLYAAIRAANFSPISFLAFGSAVKDGVEFRRMPRLAAEPFMRVVGEMLDLEAEVAADDIIEAETIESPGEPRENVAISVSAPKADQSIAHGAAQTSAEGMVSAPTPPADKHDSGNNG